MFEPEKNYINIPKNSMTKECNLGRGVTTKGSYWQKNNITVEHQKWTSMASSALFRSIVYPLDQCTNIQRGIAVKKCESIEVLIKWKKTVLHISDCKLNSFD